jgi:hypothetical protein
VVCALKPEISTGNISRILTSNDKAQHDVASDALSWQSILENLKCYCIQYNMNPILMIPQGVDFKNPANVSRAWVFFNAIDDWQKLEDEDYFQWQEFVLLYGSSVEVESDNWLEETLLLSMETTLHSKVESDMKSLPLQKQKGAITMICFIIKRMVVRNQEAKDALETYLKIFNITAFPGKNVQIACLRLKAVAQALGNDDLPKNIVRTILKGFSKSLTDTFNNVLKSKIAMRSDSMYRTLLNNSTLHNQLSEALHDLENKYQELIGGKKRAGVGHTGLLQGSLFKVSTEDPEQEIQDTHAYAAIKKIPFEEWCKKYAICHHCGKKGHICPDCEKFRADVDAGKIKLNHQPHDNRQRGVREDYGR